MTQKISRTVVDMSVNYGNEKNLIDFSSIKKSSNNLFFGLISYLRTNEKKEHSLSFEYVNKLAGLNSTTKTFSTSQVLFDFHKNVNSSIAFIDDNTFRVVNLDRQERKSDKKGYYRFVPLIENVIIDNENRTFSFRVVDNDLTEVFIRNKSKQYTWFRFSDYLEIDTPNAKTLFRLLSKFKSTGFATYSIDNLKLLMGCETVANKRFTNDILKQSVKRINDLNLELNNISMKVNRDRSNKISGVKFSFSYIDNELYLGKNMERCIEQMEVSSKVVEKLTSKSKEELLYTFFNQDEDEAELILLHYGLRETIRTIAMEEYSDYIHYKRRYECLLKEKLNNK